MANSDILFLVGSSRIGGNTATLANIIKSRTGGEVLELSNFSISMFDYQLRNKGDDFHKVINEVFSASTIVFLTPIYWYSMSAVMKIFIDRLHELRLPGEQAGKKLADKKCFLAVSGFHPDLPSGFSVPFELTANFFQMSFHGTLYCPFFEDGRIRENALSNLNSFCEKIKIHTSNGNEAATAGLALGAVTESLR